MYKAHFCDEQCVCPIHGTPLFYSPRGDEHACQGVACVHGHGGLIPGYDPAWNEPVDVDAILASLPPEFDDPGDNPWGPTPHS